jgi:hypothetical protein
VEVACTIKKHQEYFTKQQTITQTVTEENTKIKKELEKMRARFGWLTHIKNASDLIFMQFIQNSEFQTFLHKKISEGINIRQDTEDGNVCVRKIRKL